VRHDGRRVLLVASLTANIAYEVSPADWSCSCPDHRRRGGQFCKHGISGWILYRAGLSREVVAHVDRVDEITARARAEADEEGPQGAADEQEGGDDGLTYEQVEGWLRGQRWIFARTRSGNPHFYCLKRNADDPRTFERVVDFINAKGMNYVWWGSTYRQLVANNSCYWTMSDSSQAQLINAKDLEQVRKDELRNRGGGGVQWRWLHGNVQEDRRELQREEAGQDELEGV
jgi:hypothetical protein